MNKSLILFISTSLLISLAVPANAQVDERTHRDIDYSLEDKSCYEVNRAYEKMSNSGRWSADVFELFPNGNSILYDHMRFIDRSYFEQHRDSYWTSSERGTQLPINMRSGAQVFTNCQFQGVETFKGQPTLFYSADWRKGDRKAVSEIWISSVSGKFVKAILRYQHGVVPVNIPVIVETMDYDRAHAVEPPLGVLQDQGTVSEILRKRSHHPSHGHCRRGRS